MHYVPQHTVDPRAWDKLRKKEKKDGKMEMRVSSWFFFLFCICKWVHFTSLVSGEAAATCLFALKVLFYTRCPIIITFMLRCRGSSLRCWRSQKKEKKKKEEKNSTNLEEKTIFSPRFTAKKVTSWFILYHFSDALIMKTLREIAISSVFKASC